MEGGGSYSKSQWFSPRKESTFKAEVTLTAAPETAGPRCGFQTRYVSRNQSVWHTCIRHTFALLQSVVQHRFLLANAGPTFASKIGLVIFLNRRLGHVAFLYPNLPYSPCSPRPPSTPLCLSPAYSTPSPPLADALFLLLKA